MLSKASQTYVVISCAVLLAIAAAATGVALSTRTVAAHHDVHFNNYYWEEFASSPLVQVPAYDCGISQDAALQNAAAEWNASGYANVATSLYYNCGANPYGIRWMAEGTGCTPHVNAADL